MRLNQLILSIILFSFNAFSDIGDKNLCHKSNGVWRIFSHNCYDKCQKEIDKNTPCYRILEYGCDCGKDQCWQDGRCIEVKNLDKKQHYNNLPKITKKTIKPKIINKKKEESVSKILRKQDNFLGCKESGGRMANFKNSCADNCNIKKDSMCAQMVTRSCDCGPNKCWEKNKCIDQ